MTYDPTINHDTDDSAFRSNAGNSSSMLWLWIPLLVIIVGGLSLSVVAYQQNDITVVEAFIGGFIGLAGLFIGLIGGLFGLIVGLVAALFAMVTAGGAIAITLFVLASPVLAIVFLWMLTRRSKECPDPAAHEYDV